MVPFCDFSLLSSLVIGEERWVFVFVFLRFRAGMLRGIGST